MSAHPKHSKERIKQGKLKYSDDYHHPVEKIDQLESNIPDHYLDNNVKVLELFAGVNGNGNLTKWYTEWLGPVTALDESITGDSTLYIHKLIYNKEKFDVIDIDPYGWPTGLFPNIFMLMKKRTLLLFTFPKPGTCVMNCTLESKFISFWGTPRPTEGDVIGKIVDEAKKYWYIPSVIDYRTIGPINRFMFDCKRGNSNIMTGRKQRKQK